MDIKTLYESENLSVLIRKPENKVLVQWVIASTEYLGQRVPFRQRLWHLYNEVDQVPECVCGKPVKWSEKNKAYRQYCSQKCKGSCEKWRSKVAKTTLEKYGVASSLSDKATREKIKKTLIERYGVENPFSNTDIQKRLKQTNLERWGVENPAKSSKIKDKITASNMEKYGFMRYSQSHIPDCVLSIIENPTILKEKYKESYSGNSLAEELDISPWLLFKKLREHNIEIEQPRSSKEEKILVDYINGLGITNFQSGTRSIIPPKEIDIFLPDYNLAFEVNGLYWHSELRGKDKFYHYRKQEECFNKGIDLTYFTDKQVLEQPDIVKNKISSLLGFNKKIYARNCRIYSVSKEEEKAFLEENHFQGYIQSVYRFGLYYNNSLVALMTFGRSRYNKNYDYELLRFCSKNYLTVVGGASKLFKCFVKQYPGTIISYCDLSRSFNSKFYESIGFKYSGRSSPNYWYTQNYKELFPRIKFQKHKLKNLLENFNPNKTEWENMQENGWDRIWDSGNSIWIYS